MSRLIDVAIDTKVKLSALWASTMFCYIYCDYFELYVPGKLDGMLQGKMGPLGAVTQGVLVGTSALMAIPSLMIFLSVGLPARYGRILNLVVGVVFTLMLAMIALAPSWHFYRAFAGLEAVLTVLVVWQAWKWPRARSAI